jgi:ketosteroid isomerase-like protein
MKSSFALCLLATLLVTAGCAQKPNIAAEMPKIKEAVDRFTQTLQNEDMALLSRSMAHDADMVNFGTDAAERWVGWENLKTAVEKQFASFDNTKLTVRDQVIKMHPCGEVAWFSEVADWDLMAQGQPVHIDGSRVTGVLEKRDGEWVMVQFHASVPVSQQAAIY